MLDVLTILFLGTALAMVLVRRLDQAILLLALQSTILACVALAPSEHGIIGHALLAFALTVAVKVVAIPTILWRVLESIRVKREIEPVLPMKVAFACAVALTLVAYRAAGTPAIASAMTSRNALPVALAAVLIGLLLMISRRKALTQVIGLIVMENGFYLIALVATAALPLVVEIGVAFDLLVGVIVMGILLYRINQTFDTINTDRLGSLRG